MKIRFAVQMALLVASAVPLAGCYSHRGYAYQSSSSQRSASMAQNKWQPGVGQLERRPSSQGQPAQQSTETMAQSAQPSQPINEAAGAQQDAAQAPQSQATGQDNVVIQLHQETAQVGKRTVPAGQVTIHKRVTTETVQQPIELRTETVTIDREPAGAAAPAQSGDQALAKPFEESSVTIQLQKEEPVIQKNTIISGEVVARKNAQMQKSTIENKLRRETVQVEKSGDAQNVVVNGNLGAPISEAAGAQPAAGSQQDQMAAMAKDPKQFLQQAYQNNQAQLQLGQLAQQKSRNQGLKQFAQNLVQNAQATDQKLTQLAQQKDAQLSKQLDAKHQAIIDRFSNMSANFDQELQNQLVSLNQKSVDFFQQASQQNTDNDIKSFAQNNLAALRQNLQSAQSQVINEASGSQANPDQQQQQAPQDQQQQKPNQ